MPFDDLDYNDPILPQTDIVNNPEFVIDATDSTMTTFGWHDDNGESIPYSIDTMGWYEDLRTQDSIIGFILSKKCKSEIKVVMRRALPHPSDMIRINTLAHNGSNPGEYVLRYERFEIKTDFKVYSHIISGTVDYSSDYVLQFEIDDDLNDKITNLGSTIRQEYFKDDVMYSFRKKIILAYDAIISIEPIIHIPIQR